MNDDIRLVPIVIGVGDIINRSLRVEDAVEPLELMLNAIQNALKDTGLSNAAQANLQSAIDSLEVVSSWTWPYADLPKSISERLGVDPRHTGTSPHGGNQPAKLFDEAARRISKQESTVAVVVGGEALASLTVCAAQGKIPPPGWTKPDRTVDSVFSPTTRDRGTDLGGIHSIGAPIQVYPLYEHAFRAARKQSPKDNNDESAGLYADFAKVASKNPMAWIYGRPPSTEDLIGTVSKKNRMICSPYPLLMNAFNNVNLAGVCILTSTKYAEKLGVPKERWIYPLGGAGTRDSYEFWKRPSFDTSPSISQSLDAGLAVSGLTVDQIDMFDFYSCFPIVPKLACHHLGLPLTGGNRPITLLGGLTSFGGAGNNYSMHAIIQMVRHLRDGKGQTGLILANGGTVTYQHVLCLSSKPRARSSYPDKNPLPESLEDEPCPEVDSEPAGNVVIETYTVEFQRDGTPSAAFIVGRLESNGHRILANDADSATLTELADTTQEHIGKRGIVMKDPNIRGRSLFTLNTSQSRL